MKCKSNDIDYISNDYVVNYIFCIFTLRQLRSRMNFIENSFLHDSFLELSNYISTNFQYLKLHLFSFTHQRIICLVFEFLELQFHISGISTYETGQTMAS